MLSDIKAIQRPFEQAVRKQSDKVTVCLLGTMWADKPSRGLGGEN